MSGKLTCSYLFASIHLLRAEQDIPPLIFQPCGISIHLLRVEQDDKADFYEVSVWDFNPLAS